ncbi:hypothetical protein HZH68_001124 [Vespula germanica]|uniref:E3 ubiquitin-protein ligase TRIM9 n=1 Tax=Vespula germanica TaxID=30212 RepID=A0A834U6J4_VESGE|nr:hypothetical protein HZH68_001124 [Vespula germanica]
MCLQTYLARRISPYLSPTQNGGHEVKIGGVLSFVQLEGATGVDDDTRCNEGEQRFRCDGAIAEFTTAIGACSFHDGIHSEAQRNDGQSTLAQKSYNFYRKPPIPILLEYCGEKRKAKLRMSSDANPDCGVARRADWEEECVALEEEVEDRVANLVNLLQARKSRLIEAARQTREARVRSLRDQVTRCATHLQATTALLTFCIEALKETDSAAFLQIGGMLSVRAANAAGSWGGAEGVQEIARLPLLDLTLDDKPLRRAIDQLTFVQLKPPGAPLLIPEECSAENNSVTVAWQPPPGHGVMGCAGQRGPAIEGYLLELDDGCGGEFREVYCGRETICTVDGLHFNSLYNARVRAFNSAGEGEYSELIGLQTAEVAWFSWATGATGIPQEVSISEDAMSASCEGYEHRVVLSSVGFSRGVHYWELTIDRYHSDTDPAFGIARADVARDQMLGKDDKGWSMYIDRQRSWFMHGGGHAQRTEGGVQQGSTVGVLLDLETTHTLRFFVNDQAQGGVAFRDLYGVFYPAVSLNRGVTVTLHTALDVPRHLLAPHDDYLGDIVQS